MDIVSIAETKIGASFPSAQFVFEQYHLPYRLVISSKSGGILLYVKSSISSRCLSCENLSDSIQAVPFEISFTDTYDNYLILDDFNIERSGPSLKAHLNSNNPYNLIKNKTCFKDKGAHIDLFLTNRKYSFKFSGSYETGTSDHHHMIYTMLKSCFNNTQPKLLNYRGLKHFSQEAFKEDLSEALYDCNNSYDDFDYIFTSKLNKHAPKKKKWIKGNNKIHVNKAFCQAIMKRSRLKYKANNIKDPADIRNYKKITELCCKPKQRGK